MCNHEASRIHRRPHGMRKVITYCLSVSVCIGDKAVVTYPRILNRYLSKRKSRILNNHAATGGKVAARSAVIVDGGTHARYTSGQPIVNAHRVHMYRDTHTETTG